MSEVIPVVPAAPEPISIEQRAAVLQQRIAWYISQGFRVISQTTTTAQLVKPKTLSCLWVILFGITIIGLIVYVVVYLMSKDKQVYIEIDPAGQVIERGDIIIARPERATSTSKRSTTAMVLEILPGLFGILGIGWLYLGIARIGAGFMLGMLAWDAVALGLLFWSRGTALYGTIPLGIIAIIISTVSLDDHLKAHPELIK